MHILSNDIFDEKGNLKPEVVEKVKKIAECHRMSLEEITNALKTITVTGGNVENLERFGARLAEIIAEPIRLFEVPEVPVTNPYKRNHNNKKFR